jgi:hypothetical protein
MPSVMQETTTSISWVQTLLFPLLSVAVGGGISVLTTYFMHKFQFTNDRKKDRLIYLQKKQEEKIDTLKKYYFSYINYFTYLTSKYTTFYTVLNGVNTMDDWIVNWDKNFSPDYKYSEIQLLQKLYFNSNTYQDFIQISGKLSEITFVDVKNYKPPFQKTLNKEEYTKLYDEFILLGTSHQKEIITRISEENTKLLNQETT